jgi:hypothetical protein
VDAAVLGARIACGRTALGADGKAVWSWRPDAGAKFRGAIRATTVARKPVTGEITE